MGIPRPDAWNAAVEHSKTNPGHPLGPYQDDHGITQMECYNCGFDTATAVPAGHRAASAIFRQDFHGLPAFRQTIRVRGWNGLHMRAPAGSMTGPGQ